MANHSSLTGSDLHEPKGVATATSNKAYISDGVGSGVWKKITSSELDSTIKGINLFNQLAKITNFTTTQSVLIPITRSCTLTLITSIITAAIATSNCTFSFYKNGISSLGTITVAFSGSAKADIDTLTPASNNTFVAGDYLQIDTFGGTGSSDTMLSLDFTLT